MTNEPHQVEARPQQQSRSERIAKLNDALRKTGQGGAIMVTRGVRALQDFKITDLLLMLATSDHFDADNDPHGEHDFGDLEWSDGSELLWKIEYYDQELIYASPDPAVTQRVLTVMLACEY